MSRRAGKLLEFQVAQDFSDKLNRKANVTRMRLCDKIDPKRPDVEVEGLDTFKLECKYRANMVMHNLFFTSKKKYCKSKADDLILFTKHRNQNGYLVTVESELFYEMLLAWME